MIFAIADHVKQIIEHTKTQTRRSSARYQIGKLYAIQPKRTAKAIPEGKILIIGKRGEHSAYDVISESDAKQEGGYTPEQFERLYSKIHPNWKIRYAYTFRFFTTDRLERERRATLKRIEQLRVKFTLVRDFDRKKPLSESELDTLKSEIYQKIGWTPVNFTQRIVHVFTTPERKPEDEVAITGKIKPQTK